MNEQGHYDISILYVEDEPSTREEVLLFLQRRVREVFAAVNGREGLDLFQERRPDVVITDIRMPVMDGLEMAEKIKAIDRDTSIIVITAHSDASFMMNAIEIGVDHYVLKPVVTERLFAAVQKCVEIIELRRAEKKHKQEREQLITELDQAYRDMEIFSYAASHDLKAPVTRIAGMAAILTEDHSTSLDDCGRDCLHRIVQNAGSMSKLIDDLLSFCSLGGAEIQKTAVDIAELTKSTYEELGPAEPARSIELTVTSSPVAFCDRSIRQVLVNLLANAVKFTRIRQRATIETGGYRAGREDVYYVRDNGTGFDTKFADRLFTAFQRMHSQNEFEGTGIGLAIVRRIVEKHGGRVWAESAPDRGATFYFALPHVEATGPKRQVR